jgi:hypothetical protein
MMTLTDGAEEWAVVHFTIYFDYQISDDMVGECTKLETRKNVFKIMARKPEEKRPLEDLSIDGRILQ